MLIVYYFIGTTSTSNIIADCIIT